MTSNTNANQAYSAQEAEEQKSSSPETTTATTSPLFVESAQSSPAPRVRKTFGHMIENERVLW